MKKELNRYGVKFSVMKDKESDADFAGTDANAAVGGIDDTELARGNALDGGVAVDVVGPMTPPGRASGRGDAGVYTN